MIKISNYTKSQTEELLAKYTSIREISINLNVNKSTVYELLAKHNLKSPYEARYNSIHGTKLPIPSKLKIEEALKNNSSVNQAAKSMGVVHETFKKWMAYYNIEFVTKYLRTTPPKTLFPIPSKEELLKLEDEYKTIGGIAKHLKMSWSTTSGWFIHHHLTPRFKYNKGPSQFKISIPSKEILEDYYHTQTKSQTDIARIFNVSNGTIKKWFHHHDISLRPHSNNQKLCAAPTFKETCIERYGFPATPFTFHSKGELEVLDFLNENGFNFSHDRSILSGGKELDGYDATSKTAIEYCGLYFHSGFIQKDTKKLKHMHHEKYIECLRQGIQLFTIFEHEWKSRQKQVKGFLLGALRCYKEKIQARKCHITIDDPDTRDFLKRWHIQSAPPSISHSIGLRYKGHLIGVTTFSCHHRQQQQQNDDNNNNSADIVVLNRLCWKGGYSVTGGAKRMLTHALSLPEIQNKTIVTWSDNRWSIGGLYERLGFSLEREYLPDYFYTNKNGEVSSKQSKQKRTLEGLMEHETELMATRRLGWERVYDCGKKKWVLHSSPLSSIVT